MPDVTNGSLDVSKEVDELEVKRSYEVDIDVIATHKFVVDEVNSPEEAEEVARQWLDDGEEGTVSNKEVFSIDAYPVETDELKFN